MAKDKERNFGRVQSEVQGYKIRIFIKDRKQNGFGIFTTKKLIKDGFKTVVDAENYIKEKLIK